MKKVIMIAILSIGCAILIFGLFELASLASFPGKISLKTYQRTTYGVISRFHEGIIYRYPGMVPLLCVSGDYYEMGLQYGVLLQPEIMKALKFYKKILHWQAKKMKIPVPIFTAVLKYKAKKMSHRLPKRFLKEMKGISEGSGVPVDAIITISLFYDVGMSLGCTGLLMRGMNGTIIHGRNNDWFEGSEIGKLTVVVRHSANGFNSVTHIDFPLWMGVETGYNNKGLTFSEETYAIKQTNPRGFPIVFLSRMALETCSTLEEVYQLLDHYKVIGGYGTIWSDRDRAKGAIVELTPIGYAVKELQGSILWNFNHIYDANLRQQQRIQTELGGWNSDREKLALSFSRKTAYNIQEAIEFLRSRKASDGTNFSWCGTKTAICNDSGLQMVVFDPHGDGFYLATGSSYAACENVYHFHEDFSRRPQLFIKAIPIKTVIREAAMIKNSLMDQKKKLKAYVELAQKNNNDANAQFLVAYHSFQQAQWSLFANYARKAYLMKPFIAEYKLFAGIAEYQLQKMGKAIELLQDIVPSELTPLQQIYRLAILEKAWANISWQKSEHYKRMKNAILEKYKAQAYFDEKIKPLLEKLAKGDRKR